MSLVEHDVRRLQGLPGAISVNKMLEHIVQRFLLGYERKFGPLPPVIGADKKGKGKRRPDEAAAAQFAATVIARRKAEPQKKRG